MLQAAGMEPHISQGCWRGDPQPLDPLESQLPALSRDLLPVPVPWAAFRASRPRSPSGRGTAGREPLSSAGPIAGDRPGR